MGKKWKIWYTKDRRTGAPLACWSFKPDEIALEEAGYDKKFQVIKSVEV